MQKFVHFIKLSLIDRTATSLEIYKYEEKILILQSVRIIVIKAVIQGQSSTPADIPVKIFNPYN